VDSTWFKEERATSSKDELAESIAETAKALRNSTLFQRRLERILKEKLDETDRSDADFNDINWSLKAAGNASKRKTLNEIIKLIQL